MKLRGLELHADSALTCENSDIRDGNDAESTRNDLRNGKGVDGVNEFGVGTRHRGSATPRLPRLGRVDDAVLLTVQTTQSRIPVAMAARNTAWRDGEPVPATSA